MVKTQTQTKQTSKNTNKPTNKVTVQGFDITNTGKVELSVQTYFLDKVKSNGYTLKSYNQLAECSVQYNGKIKLYYVPLKNGNLKLCMYGVKIPKIDGLQGVQYLEQNTYPNKYQQRLYFKGCQLSNVQGIIDNIITQVTPKIDTVQS
jgi:hypothetical protein